ncbi:ABC transporter ATP-binding protein [Parabacteroides distasonis]|uniref:ABC transporter ATP-binding protein n=1 Tax=Parabacteroides distasonis TaxID=823 RepID=UPI0034BE385F
MINWIKARFVLSDKGAKDLCKGVCWTVLRDISLMLPAIYVFLFLEDWLRSVLMLSSSAIHGVMYYSILGLAFMVVMYVIAIFQYRSTYINVYEESANRRISLAEKLRKLPLAYFGEKNLSDLTATIMDDCTDLEHTFSHAVPQLFASIISIVLITVGMMFYNWQIAIALFWVVPIALAILLFSLKKMRRGSRDNYLNKRAVTEQIQEGLDTIQEIKSCNRELDYLAKLDEKINTYEKTMTRNELVSGICVQGSQSILKLGLASVIIAGAALLASGKVDLFTYLIFMVVASRIYAPINEVLNNLAALTFLDVRLNRMKQMEAMPVQGGRTDFIPTGYDITFDHVGFSYEEDKQVLRDVSFIARQGEITALVGPSGGGKSTTAKLAARFWDIGKGQILLGGTDISQIDPETLLKHFSIVFQDVTLFNASIMDNIRIGRRDASDEEVIRVAELACCDEFIRKLPNGYHTIIGENGETLSGGERQRISIARALLKDAPIVLLDEATASLDVENETKIQAGISELVKNKTVLIIAHRMRTIANADKIVVLADGTVIETGRPEELRQKSGIFAHMVERQTKAEV